MKVTKRRHYRPGKPVKHPPVYCEETMEIYDTFKEAAEKTGGCRQSIRNCCEYIYEQHHGLHFSYYEDDDYDVENRRIDGYEVIVNDRPGRPVNHPPIRCLNTQKIYGSFREAERDTGISAYLIKKCCDPRWPRANINGIMFVYQKGYEE